MCQSSSKWQTALVPHSTFARPRQVFPNWNVNIDTHGPLTVLTGGLVSLYDAKTSAVQVFVKVHACLTLLESPQVQQFYYLFHRCVMCVLMSLLQRIYALPEYPKASHLGDSSTPYI